MHSLKTLFSPGNLTQASTIKAFIGFIAAIGLVHWSPDQQAQAADLAVRLIAALMNFLAVVQAAYAFVNLLYNERKHIIVNTISTTAPVSVIGGATVETKP